MEFWGQPFDIFAKEFLCQKTVFFALKAHLFVFLHFSVELWLVKPELKDWGGFGAAVSGCSASFSMRITSVLFLSLF